MQKLTHHRQRFVTSRLTCVAGGTWTPGPPCTGHAMHHQTSYVEPRKNLRKVTLRNELMKILGKFLNRAAAAQCTGDAIEHLLLATLTDHHTTTHVALTMVCTSCPPTKAKTALASICFGFYIPVHNKLYEKSTTNRKSAANPQKNWSSGVLGLGLSHMSEKMRSKDACRLIPSCSLAKK